VVEKVVGALTTSATYKRFEVRCLEDRPACYRLPVVISTIRLTKKLAAITKVLRLAHAEGKTVEVHSGHGEYIGDTEGKGTDAEQRVAARASYAGILAESRVPGVAANWQRLRDRWLPAAEAVKALFLTP